MYAQISGTRIHYLVEGEGHPCMIASLPGTPIYERTLSANLRTHLKMIFVEPRGNRSEIGDSAALTLDRVVDDLDNLRAELNLEHIAVLGHSVNASIALRYAARHPDHVSQVIVIGGIPIWDASSSREQEKYWAMLASQERKEILLRNREQVKDALSKATPDDAIVINYIACSLHQARSLRDLSLPGNRLEALKHGRIGQHSIRINDQYRVCFVWDNCDAYQVEIVDYH